MSCRSVRSGHTRYGYFLSCLWSFRDARGSDSSALLRSVLHPMFLLKSKILFTLRFSWPCLWKLRRHLLRPWGVDRLDESSHCLPYIWYHLACRRNHRVRHFRCRDSEPELICIHYHIFSPLLGGALSNPASKFSSLSDNEFLITYPYFLPGFCATVISVSGVVFGYFCLQEVNPIPIPVRSKSQLPGIVHIDHILVYE